MASNGKLDHGFQCISAVFGMVVEGEQGAWEDGELAFGSVLFC